MLTYRRDARFVELYVKNSAFYKGLSDARNKLREFGADMTAIGRQLLVISAAMITPLAMSAKTFASFDDEMRKVGARSRGTASELGLLRDTAKELGATTSFTAVEVAALQAKVAQKGFDRAGIQAVTGDILNLARAAGEGGEGNTDTVVAADLVSGNLRAFLLETDQAAYLSDLFSAAVNNSNFSLEGLKDALSDAAPIAKRYNVSIKDTVNTLAQMTNVNIDAGSAGTAFRNILLKLSDEAGRNKFNASIKAMTGNTIEFVDASGDLRPLPQLLFEIGDAMKGQGTAAQGQVLSELFGLRAVVGGGVLTDARNGFGELNDILSDVEGTAKRTSDEMDAGLGGTIRNLISAVEGVQIALGEALAGALQSVGKAATNLLTILRKLIDNNHEAVITFAKWAVGIGVAGAALMALGLSATLAATAIGGLLAITRMLAAGVQLLLLPLTLVRVALSLTLGVVGLVRSAFLSLAAATAIVRAGIISIVASLGLVRIAASSLAATLIITRGAIAGVSIVFAALRFVSLAVVSAWNAIGASAVVLSAITSSIAAIRSAWLGVVVATAAVRASIAAVTIGQIIAASHAATIGTLRTAWIMVASAVALASAAVRIYGVVQLSIAGWTAISGAIVTAWKSVTASIMLAVAAVKAIQFQQMAFAAKSAVLGFVKGIWLSITTAVTAARVAIMAVNVHQLAFAAGAILVATVEHIWLSLKAAVLAVRAAIYAVNLGQIAFVASAFAMHGIRAIWNGLTLSIVAARSAMSLARIVAVAFTSSLGLLTLGYKAVTSSATLAAIASGAFSAVGSLIAALTSPIALTAAAIAGLGYVAFNASGGFANVRSVAQSAMGSVSRAAGTMRDGAVRVFGELKTTALTAFSGIKDAIASGDLALAGQIAVTGLRIIFLQGMDAIASMIGGVWGDTVSTFATQIAGGDFAGAWNTVVLSMDAVWTNFTSGLFKSFLGAARQVLTLWRATVDGIANYFIEMAAKGGLVGAALELVSGVNVKEEVEKSKKTTDHRKSLNLAKKDTEAQLSVAIAAGDTESIESLNRDLASLNKSLEQLGEIPLPDIFNSATSSGTDWLDTAAQKVRDTLTAMGEQLGKTPEEIEAQISGALDDLESGRLPAFEEAAEAAGMALADGVTGGADAASSEIRRLQDELAAMQKEVKDKLAAANGEPVETAGDSALNKQMQEDLLKARAKKNGISIDDQRLRDQLESKVASAKAKNGAMDGVAADDPESDPEAVAKASAATPVAVTSSAAGLIALGQGQGGGVQQQTLAEMKAMRKATEESRKSAAQWIIQAEKMIRKLDNLGLGTT